MNSQPSTTPFATKAGQSVLGLLRVYGCLAALALAPACGDADVRTGQGGTVIGMNDKAASASDSGAGSSNLDPECKDQKDGKSCGEDKLGRHCAAGRCVANVCGDDVRAGNEQCDDGNQASGDGCNASCQVECDGPDLDADALKLCAGGCGNGHQDGDEECDDGNRDARDECSNSCTANECGNSRVDPNEDCDDGNTKDGDECNSKCQRERCRNGRVDPGEECDDGNQIESDGCNNRCKVMDCGDGEQQDREECDDGNDVDDDKCSSKCTKNECGNGRKDSGEECDGDLQCVDCKLQDDTCTPCEEMHCRNYMESGIDFVDGCLNNKPSESFVPLPPEPGEFSEPCTAAVACARRTQCLVAGGDAVRNCYCGSAETSVCATDGPAEDAPCAEEFMKAAKASSFSDVPVRLTDLLYPSGYATFLLECDVELCKAECAPWLK